MRDYLIQNDIYEINIPLLSCGLDRLTKPELLKYLENIFKETCIHVKIYELENNFYSNEDPEIQSLLGENNSDNDTIHLDPENPINGLKFIENRLNIANNQIIFSLGSEHKIEIKKLFNNTKQRYEITLTKENIQNESMEFFKNYIIPKIRYYCLFKDNIENEISRNLSENFKPNSLNLIKVNIWVEDIENIDEQNEIIFSYH